MTGLLVPVRCPGCARTDVAVCAGCRRRVTRSPLRRRLLEDGTTAVASCPWRGPAQALVSAHKEHGRADLTGPLSLALARAVAAVAWGGEEGVTAPGSPGRAAGPVLLVAPPGAVSTVLRRGGRRPTWELARAAAVVLRAAGADVRAVPALRRTRRVADQAGLDRSQRAANLAGALAVRALAREAVGGSAVVAVDDVVTSGATVSEVARALRAAGAVVLGAASIAQV